MLETEEEARDYVATRCPEDAFAKIERFCYLLKEGTKHQNLVARKSLDQIWLRHITDSIQLADHVSRGTSPWVDFGAGAGLPGLVLAIAYPTREFVMIESRALRINWLNDMIEALGLTNAKVLGCDAKSIDPFAAAVISARAFAPLPKLLRLCAPFSTRDTEWVLPKGRSARQELHEAPKDIREMFHVKQSVTDATAGILVGKCRVTVRS